MPVEICCTFMKGVQREGREDRGRQGESRRKEKRAESYSGPGVGVGGTEAIITNSGHGQRSQDTLKFHYIDTWGTDWGQL